jgi:hypothetical protein
VEQNHLKAENSAQVLSRLSISSRAAYLVNKIGDERGCFNVVEAVGVVSQGGECVVQVVEGSEEDRRVGFEKPERRPLQNLAATFQNFSSSSTKLTDNKRNLFGLV